MKNRPINRDVIRTYFGKRAKIFGFGGYYRVTTPTGGEVVITPNHIRQVFGGEDIYRATALLAGRKWDHAKARGSREFMLGAVAHGEANGVDNVPFGDYAVHDPAMKPHLTRAIHDYFFAKSLEKLRPGGVMALITSRYTMDKQGDAIRADHSSREAAIVRGLVFVVIVVIGLLMGRAENWSGMFIALGAAIVIRWVMKRIARREEQRKAEQMGFHYPRVHGTAGAASDDDLERKGWI